ncbi:MAG: thiopurine S-methyltransferase [Pseudomonadota bacterium]
MKAEFWHEKWQRKQIGFHNEAVHPLLVAHLSELRLVEGGRVFLPLCGKTRDIAWLLAQRYRVVGVELSEIAVTELFAELDLAPSIQRVGDLQHYSAKGIDVFVGDIFALTCADAGVVDAVYDRAALVALPADMRPRYAQRVNEISARAPQLLISFDYDQSQMAGPPFSIDAVELRSYYANDYTLKLVASVDVAGGLKGRCPAAEQVYYLQPVKAPREC